VIYVDYHAALSDGHGGMRAEYSQDGVHPSRAGYEAMRPLAIGAVRAALASRASAREARHGAGDRRPH
jgi:lysophospholipase L1-like esterase